MKYLIILLAALSLPLTAQIDESDFIWQQRFYFEDAVGNRDTVTLSASPSAPRDWSGVPGQIQLRDVPFDSVFEVRVMRTGDALIPPRLPPPMYKHGIQPAAATNAVEFCEPSIDGIGISIIVYSVHPPLTVRWDNTQYNAPNIYQCFRRLNLNNSFVGYTVPDTWADHRIMPGTIDAACIASMTEKVFYPFVESSPFSIGRYDSEGAYRIVAIDSSGTTRTDTAAIYNLESFTCCSGLCDPTISTHDPERTLPFTVSPNPTAGLLNIQLPAGSSLLDLTVYDLNGRALLRGTEQTTNMDLSSLAAGVYLVRVRDTQGRRGTRRVVVSGR